MKLGFCVAVLFVVWGAHQGFCQESGDSRLSRREELLTGDIPLHDMATKQRGVNRAASQEVEAWGKAFGVVPQGQ